MTTAAPRRLEPFAVPGGFRGQLSELPFPEVLQQLAESAATGILTVVSGGARKSVYLRDGRVVFASSNVPNDRLGENLLREGKITVEEYEASIKTLGRGKRQGRALVEMGALSPKDLWEGVQFHIQQIVYSLFQWEDGQFQFEESALPEKERITVDLDVDELNLAGLRRVDAAGGIQSRYPESALVLERVVGRALHGMEAYEEHVLALVDAERSVVDICRESEIGDNETRKVLYAFLVTNLARVKGRKVHTLDQDFVPEDTVGSLVNSFNQKYGYVFRYMVREVGPIAENVLEKYLRGLRESRKEVFAGATLQKDGGLDAAVVEMNLRVLPEEERRARLVDGLNEFLYAELLAVKRTLGAEHEAAIIKAIRER
jgi:hypothetical protein